MNGTTRMLLLIIALIALLLPPMPAHAAKQTWTVIAGGATKDFSVVSNAFHPRTIEVAVGDTVAWKFLEFHTVTFLSGQKPPDFFVPEGGVNYFNPQIFFPVGGKTYAGTGYRNSGTPPAEVVHGETLQSTFAKHRYALTFTKPGTYEYLCVIHGPAMSGTVVVKARATGSPEAALAQGRREQAAILKAGQAALAKSKVEKTDTTVVLSLTGDTKAGYSTYRFSRQPVVINRGTTVTWKMADPFEIHTVTFLTGEKHPELVLVEPQKQGPPKLRFHPKVETPTATKTYDGTGFANSGILFTPGFGPPNAPGAFSLTFTKPGRYEYLCMIHDPEGMRGTIIVK